MLDIYEFFEIAMILCFGASWPFNVIKSWKTKTAKGKSLPFLVLILVGYVFGIVSKFINEEYMLKLADGDPVKWLLLASYFFNFTMVSIDFILYFRNRHYDKLKAAEATKESVEAIEAAVSNMVESVAGMEETISEIRGVMEEMKADAAEQLGEPSVSEEATDTSSENTDEDNSENSSESQAE
jgi:hypothetical protein